MPELMDGRTRRSSAAVTPRPRERFADAVLRRQLLEQRRLRLDQLAALADPSVDGPLAPLASRDDEIARELAAGARAALADVDAALARMAAGTYGACTSCGGEVPLARLEVLPQAARCMPCERVRTLSGTTPGG